LSFVLIVLVTICLGHGFNCISSSSSITGGFFKLEGAGFLPDSVVQHVLAIPEINTANK